MPAVYVGVFDGRNASDTFIRMNNFRKVMTLLTQARHIVLGVDGFYVILRALFFCNQKTQ